MAEATAETSDATEAGASEDAGIGERKGDPVSVAE